MAVNIETTTTQMFGSGVCLRRVAYDSTGRMWVALHDGANTRWEFWYSDNGTSFTEATSLRISGAFAHASFHINKVSDRAAFATSLGGFTVNGITSSSSWTAGLGSGVKNGEVVTFGKPGSTNWYWAMIGSSGAYSLNLNVDEYTSADALVGTALNQTGFATQDTQDYQAAIDFRHTGDGSTVAASTPDIFVSWVTKTGACTFRKYSWTGSGWSTGSDRSTDTGSATSQHSAAFDGTRYCMVFKNAAGTGIEVWERDAADTTSTERTPTALSDGTITGLAVAYTGAYDMVIHAVGSTSNDVKRLKFERAGGTWDTWTTVEATTAGSTTLSASKGWASGKGVGV